jgi:8-oxo-dGTP pyrophosphatase MutT (NUDIX family)
MPGKFVFPGGRLDRGDATAPAASEIEPETFNRLMTRVPGRMTARRARGLALAAVRETFEEVGLIVGEPVRLSASLPAAWRAFFATGHAPALAGLRFFARAITPPGRSRRFDARFFVADARCVANLDRPLPLDRDELLEPGWFTFKAARQLDLASITRDILERLAIACAGGEFPNPTAPVSFQFMHSGMWRRELL